MDDLVITRSISLATSLRLTKAALEKAKSINVKIHVNVVDPTGDVISYQRMAGAPLPARDFSEKKAYTAANFKQPTSIWKDKLLEKKLVANGLAQHPKVALFGGGLPIFDDDQIVGAIGIAGASEEQDIIIAQAALEALKG